MEFLRDSIWQFIGAILAFIAIAISIWIYFQQRSKKSLAYEIIAETPLLTANEEIKADLKILYKGDEVKNVHLLILKIINDGNQPILPDDFQKHLSLVFPDETKILAGEAISVSPDNLDPSITLENNILILNPLLLNSSDFVEIKLITSSDKSKFKLDTRIVGIKEVRLIKKRWNNLEKWAAVFVAVIYFVFISNQVKQYLPALMLPALALCLIISIAFAIKNILIVIKKN